MHLDSGAQCSTSYSTGPLFGGIAWQFMKHQDISVPFSSCEICVCVSCLYVCVFVMSSHGSVLCLKNNRCVDKLGIVLFQTQMLI